MFKDKNAGHIDIQGVRCFYPQMPPKIEILNHGKKPKDQKWHRQELPTFKARDLEIWDGEDYAAGHEFSWEEAVRQETIKITGCDPMTSDKTGPKAVKGVVSDPHYSMDVLDDFRKRELDRIFNGVWVYIKGKPIYLTGLHYFYLNYFFLDGLYASFRWTDCEFFYIVDVVRHPDCPDLGVFYVTRRGSGKSFKGGAAVYHTAISRKYAHCGIQSKTDDDAETFFKTKILQPMTKLPEFLIPINPHVGDITQIKKLEFAPPAKKNSNAKVYSKLKKDALYTFIDYRSAGESAYDSTTLAIKIEDELGKLDPKKIANAEKRLQTNIFCVLRGVEKKGFIIATSTIEEEMSGGKEAKKIWDNSDSEKRSKNGRTVSGLVRLFCSALEDSYFDEYGFPDIEKSRAYHDAERDKLKHDPSSLVSYKQKNPYTPEEAFWFGGNKCIYNAEVLVHAKDKLLQSARNFVRQGDIIWKEVDKEAVFVDNNRGRWIASFLNFEPNQTKIDGDRKIPLAAHKRVIGFDPFSVATLADENKGSDGAAAVFNKFDINIPEEYSETFILDYLHRPPTPEDCFEDILTAAFFLGCGIFVEVNKGGNDFINYAKRRGYKWGYDSNPDDFIMERPESTLTKYSSKTVTEGIYTTESFIIQYTNATSIHIAKHGRKLKHLRVIDDWLQFDPKKTKKFDMGVAASMALVAAEVNIKPQGKVIDIGSLFKTYNNTGSRSVANSRR